MVIIQDPLIAPYIIKVSDSSFDIWQQRISKETGKSYETPSGKYFTSFEQALKHLIVVKLCDECQDKALTLREFICEYQKISNQLSQILL